MHCNRIKFDLTKINHADLSTKTDLKDVLKELSDVNHNLQKAKNELKQQQ